MMGLDHNGTRFLLDAKRRGVDFTRTATIGRQGLHLSPGVLQCNLRDFGIIISAAEAARLTIDDGGFAESFLRLLGATEICSFDASDYEGATHVRDLNFSLGDELREHFTAVIDSGSLEHIFNFPQAVANCMGLVAPGGHFLANTPANAFCGHGFYQFSPELLFRVFTPANGFTVESMRSSEEGGPSVVRWSDVPDPETVKRRVFINCLKETSLLMIAKKMATVPLFAETVQQSDYVHLWEKKKEPVMVAEPIQKVSTEKEKIAVVVLSKYPDIFSSFKQSVERCVPNRPKILVRDGRSIPNPGPGWAVVQGPDKFSMAGNANLGWQAVPIGHDILYVGDDVRFTQIGSEDLLRQDAYSDPTIGILSPHINGAAANPLQTAKIDRLQTTERTLAFVCIYVKRELIDKIGYLDEQFNSYGFDDDDYCLRARYAGYKLAVTPRVTVIHGDGSQTFRRSGTWVDTEGRRKFEEKWVKP